MPSVRKRLETLERSQSERGGTSKDQIVRRVLEGVSDAELDLLGSAACALAQGRELTPAECADKALLPEWLMEDLRQQGIRFDASGLPEKSSLEEKALERIAPATPAPSLAPPRGFYG